MQTTSVAHVLVGIKPGALMDVHINNAPANDVVILGASLGSTAHVEAGRLVHTCTFACINVLCVRVESIQDKEQIRIGKQE